MKQFFGCLLATMSLGAFSLRAQDEVVAHYHVRSRGIGIGDVETIRTLSHRDGKEYMRCQVITKLGIDIFIMNYHRDSTEDVLLGPGGVEKFSIKSNDDGDILDTSGAVTNGVFYGHRVFNGVTNDFAIARTNYEGTTMDGLEMTLKKGAPAKTMRLFDCMRGAVITRTYQWTGDEDIEINGKEQPCRVIEYADDQKKGTRWVYADALGMAVARQDAHEPSGSYTLRIKDTEQHLVSATNSAITAAMR